MNIQTRAHSGEILNFPTFQDALTHARENADVWKISFSIQDGSRIRLIRTTEGWTYENVMTGGRFE